MNIGKMAAVLSILVFSSIVRADPPAEFDANRVTIEISAKYRSSLSSPYNNVRNVAIKIDDQQVFSPTAIPDENNEVLAWAQKLILAKANNQKVLVDLTKFPAQWHLSVVFRYNQN